jgi:hypothetical protein
VPSSLYGRPDPLLQSGDQVRLANRFKFLFSNLIDEHVEQWITNIPQNSQESFEGRL